MRPSQFVLLYGPGAIFEGQHGSRIIPTAKIGLKDFINDLAKYQIDDDVISKGALDGGHSFRLPTNSELPGYNNDPVIYKTFEFPSWKLCMSTKHNETIMHKNSLCPVCSGSRSTPIRFVMACKHGHLDDIDWIGKIDHKDSCSRNSPNNTSHLLWINKGASVSKISIQCPTCNEEINMGKLYSEPADCTARYPELGPYQTISPCSEHARVIARQAANIRIPEITTLLMIGRTDNHLHTLIRQFEKFQDFIENLDDDADLDEEIDHVSKYRVFSKDESDILRSYSIADLKTALRDVQNESSENYNQMILNEFHHLIHASKHGNLTRSNIDDPSSKVIFQIDKDKILSNKNSNFLITPIQKLHTISIQKGYRREIPSFTDSKSFPKLIKSSFKHADGKMWYPGVDFFGEGIFIQLKKTDVWKTNMNGKQTNEWLKIFNDRFNHDTFNNRFLFRDDEQKWEIHPGFVWWHTLSHLLLRAIGEETGYSNASIRERIYFEYRDNMFHGGIMLYATNPGSEGSMGGLTGIVDHVSSMLEQICDLAQSCSGDPLCVDQHITPTGYNGAACYGCLMNSETSCEHRNMWLDRHVLQENKPR